MSKDLKLYEAIESIANERSLAIKEIVDVVCETLLTAIKRRFPEEQDLVVRLEKDRELYVARRLKVVADHDYVDEYTQIPLSEAQALIADATIGMVIEKEVPSLRSQRIISQTARQILVQRFRDIERSHVANRYRGYLGQLLQGTVKRVDRQAGAIVTLNDEVEALLPKEAMIPQQHLRSGDKVRALLLNIREENHGAQLLLSRTDAKFLQALMAIEIPEIGQGVIKIYAAARDPGSRAKVAVRSLDPRLDPVGACIGMRGARIQAVIEELHGERVDIIVWDENPGQYIINAMAPAEIVSIFLDVDVQRAEVVVPDDKRALAIGRNGQNVNLASKLTGWEIKVLTESEAEAKKAAERQAILEDFQSHLEIDRALAQRLLAAGFYSIEEIAYVPKQELLQIKPLTEALIEQIRLKARAYLALQQQAESAEEDTALAELPAMQPDFLELLAENGVNTLADLADLSIADLLDFIDIPEETAALWIMTARRTWFPSSS
jgi:N utilization substance protein A